jgi:hypothetical protein
MLRRWGCPYRIWLYCHKLPEPDTTGLDMTLETSLNWPRFAVRSANAGHASNQSAQSETRDCQSGFNLLNALESGFHSHSGSGDIALHVSEQIARLVPLIDGEFSRG